MRKIYCKLFHRRFWFFDKEQSKKSTKKVEQKEVYSCTKCKHSFVFEHECYD